MLCVCFWMEIDLEKPPCACACDPCLRWHWVELCSCGDWRETKQERRHEEKRQDADFLKVQGMKTVRRVKWKR